MPPAQDDERHFRRDMILQSLLVSAWSLVRCNSGALADCGLFFRTPAPKQVWVPFQKKRSCLGSRAHFRSLRAGCPMQFRDKFQTEETHMSLYENSIRIKGFL